MKSRLLIFLAVIQLSLRAQCVADFIYTLQPNGTITLSNTSVYSGTSTPFFTWNLGNGTTFTTTSLSQVATTTYTANGTYSISLDMSDSGSLPCSSSQFTVLPVTIAGCALSASASAVNSGTGTATVSFFNLTTGTISGTTFTWNLGDGTTSNFPTPPVHVYEKNGVYGYSLNVTNNSTCSAFYYVSAIQNVGNLTGTAVEHYTTSVSMSPGASGLVVFTVHKQVFNTGFANIYFDDGVSNTGYNADTTFDHIFYDGVYTPTVELHGYTSGPRVHVLGPITITNNPCYVSSAFTYTTLSGGVVQFAAPSQIHNNIKYFWDFGDGGPAYLGSVSPNPVHTYGSAGSFSVQLITVDTTYFPTYPSVALPYHSPCQDIDTINVNVNNIACISSSAFTFAPSGIPHVHYLYPAYPYNVINAHWDWGDGTSYVGPSIYASHTYSAAGFYNICLTVTTSCGTSSTTCIEDYFAKGSEGHMVTLSVVQPTNALSVKKELADSEEISVFPNPSAGRLFISMKNNSEIKEFEIFNALGEKVLSGNTDKPSGNLNLDLNSLSNGVYFLNIYSGTQQFRSKFVLQK